MKTLSASIASSAALAAFTLAFASVAVPAQSPARTAAAETAGVATPPIPTAAVTTSLKTPAEPIHIGVLTPRSSVTDPSAQAIGEQVRVLLARNLSSAEVDTVLLFSSAPDQVIAEAKQHHCAFIVDSTVTQKKGSGLNKMMLLQGASMMMPMASMAGSMGGMIASAAAGTAASTASSMTGFMHPNTTWTFEYKLVPVGEAQPVLAQSESAKAKKEGEDVLTPLVQHAAAAIATQARK